MFKKSIFLIFAFLIFGNLTPVFAQELYQDFQGTWRAEVVNIIDQDIREIPGTKVTTKFQILEAKILAGPKAGEIIEIENDFIMLKRGDKFFLNHLATFSGDDIYSVGEPDRRAWLAFFLFLFIGTVFWFSRWQGLRAIISLIGSFLVIFYILLPQLLAGTSPVLISTLVAIIILTLAIYLTHGLHRESTTALLGTTITITLTGGLAYLAVHLTYLSGFASDEAVFLNLNTGGQLNFQGLLLGAIIIGVIGVLDDIAITQAATVSELHHSAPHLTRQEVASRALRIGREHVASLVNTLVFAYTGAALPLLLLFSASETSALLIVNREIFATEIIRTTVGSIGLILTVPISTWIGVWLLYGRPKVGGGHSHHHGNLSLGEAEEK